MMNWFKRHFPAKYMRFGAMILLCGVLPTCKSVDPHTTSAIAEAGGPIIGDLEVLLNGRLRVVCGVLLNSPDPTCKSVIITAVCSQRKNSLAEAVEVLRQEPILAALTKRPEDAKALDDALTKDFYSSLKNGDESGAASGFSSAVDRCMNYEHHKEAAEFAEEAATPEFQARASAARRSFWADMILGTVYSLGQQAVNQGVSYGIALKAAPNTALSLKSFFVLGLCSGAADLVAAVLGSSEVDWEADQCKDVGESDKAGWGACVKLVGSACNAATGAIDIRNLGIKSNSDAVNFFVDITNLGGFGACQLGGPLSRGICGVTNSVANQYQKFFTTGTNDLAECFATTKIGRCLGQIVGSGGWTNNNRIAMPRREKDENGEEWWVKRCCLCQSQAFEYKKWGKWEQTGSEWNMSVIQEGDFATGSCGAKEDKKITDASSGGNRYVKYSSCQAVDVIGGSCALEEHEGSVVIDRKRIVWDSGTRKVLNQAVSKTGGLYSIAESKPVVSTKNCKPSGQMGTQFNAKDGSLLLDCTGVTYLRCEAPIVCCGLTNSASDTRINPEKCAEMPWLNPK